MKQDLKVLNRDVFRIVDQTKKNIINKIVELDKVDEDCGLHERGAI